MASTAAEEAEDAAPDGLNDLSAMSMAQAPAWGPLEYPPARREAGVKPKLWSPKNSSNCAKADRNCG